MVDPKEERGKQSACRLQKYIFFLSGDEIREFMPLNIIRLE
jgi:hypothetical protein